MQTLTLSQRDIPVKGEYDLIVCGGGPAGAAAALSAARQGVSVLLIERNQCCGGIWTAGAMPWILDHKNKTGILDEIRTLCLERGGMIHASGSLSCPTEALRLLLEELLEDAGVQLRYGTLVTGVQLEGKRLTHVVTESKSGTEAWQGKCFIDCTGDGDLAALAGCSFEFGGDDGNTQPSSFIGIVCGLDPDEVSEYLASNGGKPKFKALMESHGVYPSYGMPSLFHLGQGVFALMSNHGYKVNAIDADNLTRKVIEGRRELHTHVNFLRSLGGIWRNIALAGSSDNLGVREGRRIKGVEYVDWKHLGSGGRCPNAVCRATFCVDVHAPDPAKGNVIAQQKVSTKPYDIPWGALVSAERENLLMAGRCISGDFIAHSSYRVTGNSVPLGEAAGFGAAISIKENILPSEVKNVPFFSTEQ
jgi:hypothetical protein